MRKMMSSKRRKTIETLASPLMVSCCISLGSFRSRVHPTEMQVPSVILGLLVVTLEFVEGFDDECGGGSRDDEDLGLTAMNGQLHRHTIQSMAISLVMSSLIFFGDRPSIRFCYFYHDHMTYLIFRLATHRNKGREDRRSNGAVK